MLLPDAADAHFGVGLDDIGFDNSEENRSIVACRCLAYFRRCFGFCSTASVTGAACRDFSWEKNYPGDEGISGIVLISLHGVPVFLTQSPGFCTVFRLACFFVARAVPACCDGACAATGTALPDSVGLPAMQRHLGMASEQVAIHMLQHSQQLRGTQPKGYHTVSPRWRRHRLEAFHSAICGCRALQVTPQALLIRAIVAMAAQALCLRQSGSRPHCSTVCMRT